MVHSFALVWCLMQSCLHSLSCWSRFLSCKTSCSVSWFSFSFKPCKIRFPLALAYVRYVTSDVWFDRSKLIVLPSIKLK